MVTFAQEQLQKAALKENMFKRIRELYKEYKAYVRVDLIMYGVLILMILLYVIISSLIG